MNCSGAKVSGELDADMRMRWRIKRMRIGGQLAYLLRFSEALRTKRVLAGRSGCDAPSLQVGGFWLLRCTAVREQMAGLASRIS